jgi:release factor glutamine methyltransferase
VPPTGASARRVAEQARDWLAPGGGLFVEADEEQAPVAAALLAAAGLRPDVLSDAAAGATVVRGVSPAAAPRTRSPRGR